MVYQSDDLPSSRIRVRELAPHLVAHGFEVSIRLYPPTLAERVSLFEVAKSHDLVLIQKKLPSFVDGILWRRLGRSIVFDYDDAIMMRDHARDGSYESATRKKKFDRAIDLASAVVAGNEYLASFVPSTKRRLVLPTPVPHRVPVREHRAVAELRVGWIGLGKNLGTLAPIADVLREAQRRFPFVLTVISNESPDLPGVRTEWWSWSRDSEDEMLSRVDLGIMALAEDSPWDKGKCSYKVLKYMAAGLPVIASRVGMNEEVVTESSGFLVTSPAEWMHAFERLCGSVELRRQMGASGRELVLRTLTFEAVAARLGAFLHEV